MRQFAMFDRAKLLFITPSDEKNTAGRICLLGLTTGIRQESKHLRFWQHLSEWWDISKKNKPKNPVRIKMIHISCVTPAGLSMNLRVSTEAGCATSKGESNISSLFHHTSITLQMLLSTVIPSELFYCHLTSTHHWSNGSNIFMSQKQLFV